jgi:hypothetical protein
MRIASLALVLFACGGSTEEPKKAPPNCTRLESIDDECGGHGYTCRIGIGPEGCKVYYGPGGSPVYTERVCCDE